MIPQNFDYSSPTSLQEALKLVEGGGGKLLAGGMSLIPMMKLRLASPEHVVDLGRIGGLKGIREEAGKLHIGAMTTHYEIESSPLVRAKCPLLAEAASSIGDVQVRNMGTIGGSVAHNDPAADYPASLLALEAEVKLASASGERTLLVEDFLVDTLTTALEPGEIISEIIVPVEAGGAGTSYKKMLQPASGFAIVGVAVRIRPPFIRVGVTGLAGKAFRARNVEEAYARSNDAAKAAAVVAGGVDANSDLHASAEYRKQMAVVYATRAIQAALAGVR